MAALESIWMGISYAALLALVAIIGFLTLKIGVISFKIIMDVITAAKGIENIEGVVRYPKYGITEDDDEIINSFIKKNHYAKYTYNLFKVKTILSCIDSFKSFIKSKSKNNFAKYAYIQLFKK